MGFLAIPVYLKVPPMSGLILRIAFAGQGQENTGINRERSRRHVRRTGERRRYQFRPRKSLPHCRHRLPNPSSRRTSFSAGWTWARSTCRVPWACRARKTSTSPRVRLARRRSPKGRSANRSHADFFACNPALYDNSPGKFCCEWLLRTLQEQLGVRYNPAQGRCRFSKPIFHRPRLSKRPRPIHPRHDGWTRRDVRSMPVMYAAVARRRGWPLMLVEAPGQLFCRFYDRRRGALASRRCLTSRERVMGSAFIPTRTITGFRVSGPVPKRTPTVPEIASRPPESWPVFSSPAAYAWSATAGSRRRSTRTSGRRSCAPTIFATRESSVRY